MNYVATPSSFEVKVNPDKHTKTVYDKFHNWKCDVSVYIAGFVKPTKEEAVAAITDDIKKFAESLISSNPNSGLTLDDFEVRIWYQPIQANGMFILAKNGGLVITLK